MPPTCDALHTHEPDPQSGGRCSPLRSRWSEACEVHAGVMSCSSDRALHAGTGPSHLLLAITVCPHLVSDETVETAHEDHEGADRLERAEIRHYETRGSNVPKFVTNALQTSKEVWVCAQCGSLWRSGRLPWPVVSWRYRQVAPCAKWHRQCCGSLYAPAALQTGLVLSRCRSLSPRRAGGCRSDCSQRFRAGTMRSISVC